MLNTTWLNHRSPKLLLPIAWLTLVLALVSSAAVPTPDKLLPDDTLAVITAPDFTKLREAWKKLPQGQLWNDPAMKPFRERLVSKWNEEVVKPLERDLGIKFDDYLALLQGQVTLAVLQNGWQGDDEPAPAFVLVLDAKDKKEDLKRTLSDFRKKWVDSGKTIRTEKVRDIEFLSLSLSSNDVPKTLSKLLPKPSAETEEPAEDSEPKKPAAQKTDLFIGQVDSALVVGTAIKAVEKVVAPMTGGSVPPLSEMAAYQANHQALFREAPLYAWANTKTFFELLLRNVGEKKEDSGEPNPFDISPEKIVKALGLGGLKTVAFSFQNSDQGSLFVGFLGVPEASRQGVFKILAGEPKEANPPPFVPAEAVKFQRWRIDGQKTWAALERMISDISPQWLSGINFLLETANTAAKEKDPGFDVKKNLIGNLGDDIITYQKPGKTDSLSALASPPSLFLIGSSKPEELAVALKSLLLLAGQQSGTAPEEREFLGRKIYSMPVRAMGLPMGAANAGGAPVTLRYAGGNGYLAVSTDVSILEEFLRSSESQGKRLKDTAGLNEAAQKVLSPGASLFGYENQAESARGWFELFRKDSASSTNSPAGALAALFPGGGAAMREWVDFSLLPPFEKISKYFYFSVYGGGASVDGLTFKAFSPVSPEAKEQKNTQQ